MPATLLGRHPKRVRVDPGYRDSVSSASTHHLPHSAYLDWDPDDLAAEAENKGYQAECCPNCGVHPSTWSPKHGGDIRRPEWVPEWTYCRVDDLVEQAEAAGPPPGKDAKGWSLRLVRAFYDEPKEARDG